MQGERERERERGREREQKREREGERERERGGGREGEEGGYTAPHSPAARHGTTCYPWRVQRAAPPRWSRPPRRRRAPRRRGARPPGRMHMYRYKSMGWGVHGAGRGIPKYAPHSAQLSRRTSRSAAHTRATSRAACHAASAPALAAPALLRRRSRRHRAARR